MHIQRTQAATPHTFLRNGALAIGLAVFLGACGKTPQGNNAGGAPAAPSVGVVTVSTTSVPSMVELPGRTTTYRIAEIRPQVGGIVKDRVFREGSDVKAGALLYQIDPATYKAAYASAQASLSRAQANLYAARLKAERYADLVKIDAVSRQDNDDAVAALKQAEADVAAARAAADKARIDLDYTRITAPIGGRIGRSSVSAGALVTANQATALATVQQLDPIYVDLTQSSTDLRQLQRDLDAGRIKQTGGTVPVQLVFEDGSTYRATGKLAFSEMSVDPGTGSVTLRAVFPNPGGELLPGMYVRARIEQGVKDGVQLVPHAAVSRDPKGNAVVMVVNGEDTVEARQVKAERSYEDKWIVTDGLAAGERIVVEGLQKIRAGAKVKAEPIDAKPEQTASAPAAR